MQYLSRWMALINGFDVSIEREEEEQHNREQLKRNV